MNVFRKLACCILLMASDSISFYLSPLICQNYERIHFRTQNVLNLRGNHQRAAAAVNHSAADDYSRMLYRSNIEEINMRGAPSSALVSPVLESSDGREEYRAKVLSEMKKNGLVRINNVLSKEAASSLLSLVMNELDEAKEAVAQGENVLDRFSNLLSSCNRWDLKLRWSQQLSDALCHIVRSGTPLGDLLASLASSNGTVHELAAFVTLPGAGRQVLHADTLWSATPSVFTCTIALQDVTVSMGPTIFLPSTHTRAAHRSFDSATTRQGFLAETPHVLSTLEAGDAAIYDSRVLHCGGANRSRRPRVLLYLSLLHPQGPLATGRADVANVASIHPELIGRLTLADLRRPRGLATRPPDDVPGTRWRRRG